MVAILYQRDNCKCIRVLKSDVRGTKKTTPAILKAAYFSRFQSGSWGREYWVFHEVFMSAIESASMTTTQDYA
jgi:hypothetical protein